MDARKLALRPGSVDAVVDKGCLDAALAVADRRRMWRRLRRVEEGDLVDPTEAICHRMAVDILDCVSAVLVEGGRYLMVTYEDPSVRAGLLLCSRLRIVSSQALSEGEARRSAPSERG